MRKLAALCVGLGFLAAACSPPKADLAAEERAIREQDAKWLKAVASRDAAAEAALIQSDAVIYRANHEPLVGPAAFQAYETKYFAENPKGSSSWTTAAIHVAESGDWAIQTGAFHATGIGAKGDIEDKGRFVTAWKKVNGEWKVAYDIGATTMPVPVPPKK